MSMSYQQLFDICVRAVKAGRNEDPKEKFCNCGSRVMERGCHIDALLGEKANLYIGMPLCTGCIIAPSLGEKEHRAGTSLAKALVEAGVPATYVSADILDHFSFIHDLAGDDWSECIEDCAANVLHRHKIELSLKSLKGGTVH